MGHYYMPVEPDFYLQHYVCEAPKGPQSTPTGSVILHSAPSSRLRPSAAHSYYLECQGPPVPLCHDTLVDRPLSTLFCSPRSASLDSKTSSTRICAWSPSNALIHESASPMDNVQTFSKQIIWMANTLDLDVVHHDAEPLYSINARI
ncbi:hypothetical protein JD844_009330 [Phrynosoma platyrhinos]|uniref:Uncharacterized protein n=1 Tax=Phrynosoma platyrhinos TaxID=52577 RepID=A0ABQ7TF14_PHRPL|nr:hypothetical protein JD844_009330 [Phrynosoma platyrhinos]